MEFKEVLAIPLSKYPEKILITWATNIPESKLSEWEFIIERSYTTEGLAERQVKDLYGNVIGDPENHQQDKNFSEICKPIDGLEAHEYIDCAVQHGSLMMFAFYRVIAVNKKTDERFRSFDFTTEEDPDLVGIYIVDEHNFALQDASGTPCLAFRRKLHAPDCPVCIDPIQRKPTKSNCKECFATGKVGGYYQPADLWIDFQPDPKDTNVQDWGRSYPSNTTAFMTNFPDLQPRDVILELRNGRMWTVEQVREVHRRRVLLFQYLSLQELKPGSPEYGLKPSEEFIRKKAKELHDLNKRREF